MSTRLILIELEEPSTADGMAKAVSVWELPTAEELGRVVLQASAIHFAKYGLDAVDEPGRKAFIGEAILATLKGGHAKTE